MSDEDDDRSEVEPFVSMPVEIEKVRDDDREHVWDQVASKRWDELGVLELEDGRIIFPECIYRREISTGKFIGDAVVLQVPRGSELRKARVEAYAIAKADKIDPEKDKVEFEDLVELCKLWLSIRSPKHPYEPLTMDARGLERKYDRPSLEQVNGKLAQLRRILDPKLNGMSADEMAALSAALVARQHLGPLFAFDDATQQNYFITMATLHLAYLKARSSRGPSEQSTAA